MGRHEPHPLTSARLDRRQTSGVVRDDGEGCAVGPLEVDARDEAGRVATRHGVVMPLEARRHYLRVADMADLVGLAAATQLAGPHRRHVMWLVARVVVATRRTVRISALA